MRSIISVSMLCMIVTATGLAFAASGPPAESPISQEYFTPKYLCLNTRVNSDILEASAYPVYDWVHAGQQGVRLTITNKTGKDMAIDWNAARDMRPAGREPGESMGAPRAMRQDERSRDVIGPGVTYSKVLWPPSGAVKEGTLHDRNVRVSVALDRGEQQFETIVLNVAGGQQLCSR